MVPSTALAVIGTIANTLTTISIDNMILTSFLILEIIKIPPFFKIES